MTLGKYFLLWLWKPTYKERGLFPRALGASWVRGKGTPGRGPQISLLERLPLSFGILGFGVRFHLNEELSGFINIFETLAPSKGLPG